MHFLFFPTRPLPSQDLDRPSQASSEASGARRSTDDAYLDFGSPSESPSIVASLNFEYLDELELEMEITRFNPDFIHDPNFNNRNLP